MPAFASRMVAPLRSCYNWDVVMLNDRRALACCLAGIVLMAWPRWGRALLIDQLGEPSVSHSARISDDEWKMIEAACRNPQRSHGHAAYLDCLSRQVKALEASPGKPSLSSVSAERRAAIEVACRDQRVSHGPAAYYSCLDRQLRALSAQPTPSLAPGQDSQNALETQIAAKPEPHSSADTSRPVQQGSKTSPEALKQQAEPPLQGAATTPEQNSAPDAPSAAMSPLRYVLGAIIVAAVVVGFSWNAYHRSRRPKCIHCGNRFKGSGAYCPRCLAAMQEKAKQAADYRQAEEQAKVDERNRRRTSTEQEAQGASSAREHTRQGVRDPKHESATGFDPYVILGVARNASKEEIRAAYLREMASYHPDKVAHLGQDLQELAKRKSQAINRAYDALVSAL